MDRLFKRLILIFAAAGFLTGGDLAAANPIGDFFKRLGNSLAHPGKTKPPRRNTQKSGARSTDKKPSANKQNGVEEAAPENGATAGPSLTPTPAGARPAASVAQAGNKRRDVPYGVPVPNKPGFVTSPHSPKAGYVDVRGFPSGTEVKDPYTGKVFLTP